MCADERPPPGVDPATPNVARIYDYFLGGTENFAVDREAAERVLEMSPEVRSTLRANRSFVGRVVRHLAGQARIEQFIDVGAGLPTQENVHQVALAANPRARVAYVDGDPVVMAHARSLLAGSDAVAVVPADLRRPHDVLTHPELRRLIDRTRPVAVLMTSVLHFVGDADDPAAIVAGYRDALAPGSFLALSLGTTEGVDPRKIARAQEVYRGTGSPLTYRSRAQILRLFHGFELVEPGLVRLPEWRPDSEQQALAESDGAEWMLGGVGGLAGRRPTTPDQGAT